MVANEQRQLTTGEIAEKLGVRHHRVLYAIRRRGIAHVSRVGIFRIYDDAAMREIERFVNRHGGRGDE